MRRTRFVLLPVKSWQYVGLMVVSLACLTLGLVSRDREGKSGSLVGPELKHIAPHEVDACPNTHPFSHRLLSDDDLATHQGPEDEIIVSSIHRSRVNFESPGTHERRISRERPKDNSRNVRLTLENRRLSRSSERRDSRDANRRENMRRSVLIERRITDVSRIRDARIGRSDRRSRSLASSSPRVSSERRNDDTERHERRINQISRSRSLDSQQMYEEKLRRVRSGDRKITDHQVGRENLRLSTRTLNIRNFERRMTRNNKQEERITRFQTSRNVDRIEFREKNFRLPVNSVDRRDVRFSDRRNRQVDIRTQSNDRRVDSRRDIRKSNIRSEEQTSAERRQIKSVERRERLARPQIETSRLNVRSKDRRSSQRREIRSAERREFSVNPLASRIIATEQRKSVPSIVREEIPWVDSLRRNVPHIRTIRASGVARHQTERHATRELSRERRTSGHERRISRSGESENIQQRRFLERSRTTEQNRSGRFNGEYKNYLMTVPKLLDINMISADGTYKLLRQAFVLALCTVYTMSLFKRKSQYEFFRTTSSHVKRFLVW